MAKGKPKAKVLKKKVPAKKVPAKKVPAKKVPAKKVPAKKVPAKRGRPTKARIKNREKEQRKRARVREKKVKVVKARIRRKERSHEEQEKKGKEFYLKPFDHVLLPEIAAFEEHGLTKLYVEWQGQKVEADMLTIESLTADISSEYYKGIRKRRAAGEKISPVLKYHLEMNPKEKSQTLVLDKTFMLGQGGALSELDDDVDVDDVDISEHFFNYF